MIFTQHIMNMRNFVRHDSIWPPVCLDRHIKIIKGFKLNVFAFEELCFSPSASPLLVPLPHFLTLVFSSSPFSRLPQSLEFAAGQKAAAEAQPIWNAAPPFWRSEGEEGTRLVVNQDAKSTSCLCTTNTLSQPCNITLELNWNNKRNNPVRLLAMKHVPMTE